MAKKVGVMFVPGACGELGDPEAFWHEEMMRLEAAVRSELSLEDVSEVVFHSITWHDLIYSSQFSNIVDLGLSESVPDTMGYWSSINRLIKFLGHSHFSKKKNYHGDNIRQKTYGFMRDALAIICGNRLPDSIYTQIQQRVRQGLRRIYSAAASSPIPVIVVAQSFGTHIIANYISDSEPDIEDAKSNQSVDGIWLHESTEHLPEQEQRFLRFKTLCRFISTGCGFPLTNSLSRLEIVKLNNSEFKWVNYWSENDLFGWPLKSLVTLDNIYPFGSLVHEEICISRQTEVAEYSYWKDKIIIDRIVFEISEKLKR